MTHNANLIVNTDADQVIVVACGPHRPGRLLEVTYRSGGFENSDIRHLVCDIFEGGETAFRERARRLRVQMLSEVQMEGHNFENLKAHILSLSVSQRFDTTRTEWFLVAVEISEEFDQCPCGQEIKEHYYIRNRRNDSETYVGNICINRFIQIDTGRLSEGLGRIAKKLAANENINLIEYAYRKGYLYGEKEYIFLIQTMRKRTFLDAQIAWKVKINRRIVAQAVVRKRSVR